MGIESKTGQYILWDGGEQGVREPLDMEPPILSPSQREMITSRPNNKNNAPTTTANDYRTNHEATTTGDDDSTTDDSNSHQPKTTRRTGLTSHMLTISQGRRSRPRTHHLATMMRNLAWTSIGLRFGW